MSLFADLLGGPNCRERAAKRVLRWIGLLLIAGTGAVAPASGQSSPVPKRAAVDLVASGFQFTEGPLWFKGELLFSDIPANTVYRWAPGQEARAFMNPSGRANGLAVGPDGHLLLAQHEGQVARRTDDGTVEPLVASYGGRRLNSPNDLTVASDGTVYFTDPPYGVEENARRLDFSGVYRLSPNGNLSLLTKRLPRPNGIGLSPNDSTLYVTDSRDTKVWAYDVTAEGEIRNRRSFATPRDDDAEGTTDGMTIDVEGNVYTTGPGGVWVYAPGGRQLARIAVPKAPTNVAFGGPERKTLYITARPHVYRVSVNIPGAQPTE
jgi:gluconolactonase